MSNVFFLKKNSLKSQNNEVEVVKERQQCVAPSLQLLLRHKGDRERESDHSPI